MMTTAAIMIMVVAVSLGGCALYHKARDDVPRQINVTLWTRSF
jgi:hypothetical protein